MPDNLETMIEALLFESGEGYTVSDLSRILKRDEDEVEEALSDLAHTLKETGRGVRLLRDGDRAVLVASKVAAALIAEERKSALSGPLTPAALEALTIILYLGPIEKKNIDYIRGVNSQGILRVLRARDLVKNRRVDNVLHYIGTLSLLRSLGVERAEDLPDYARVRKQFEDVLSRGEEDTTDE